MNSETNPFQSPDQDETEPRGLVDKAFNRTDRLSLIWFMAGLNAVIVPNFILFLLPIDVYSMEMYSFSWLKIIYIICSLISLVYGAQGILESKISLLWLTPAVMLAVIFLTP